MPLYEHVYMARQDVTAQAAEELSAAYKAVIEGLGGKVTKSEYWGVKSLAYRIKKNRKAHFTLFNIDGPPAAINELERQQRLSEDVLRFLTVRVEALEEGPSAMLQKRDRDDARDERGGGRGFGGGGGGGGGRFGGRGGDRGERGDRGDREERRPRRDDASAPSSVE